ncbi:MAG: methyltransferase domain-containing protein, partial [Spirochaetaceae bacterium]|nr:methyltransferase domain-containing protein [Spirochaetaceae bacterium]
GDFARPVLAALGISAALVLSAAESAGRGDWDLIILDRFAASPEEYRRWASLAPVLGIDEGGPLRSSFDFLLDLLPRATRGSVPNWVRPGLLPLGKNRRPSFDAASEPGTLRVLVSFGVEDGAGLALASARVLSRLAESGGIVIDILGPRRDLPGTRRKEFTPCLREELASYDLLVTHFGLTCFEALYARLPVLLLSPTAYHEKLCQKAALPSLGIGKKGLAALEKLCRRMGSGGPGADKALAPFREQCAAAARRFGLEAAPGQTLGQFIAGLEPELPGGGGNFRRACPVCGGENSAVDTRVLGRFGDRTYRRCSLCRTVYMDRAVPPPVVYGKNYFFEDYKKQYGKTYLEDFPHLRELAALRLNTIQAMSGPAAFKKKPRLLDIGCAYGAFLAEARDRGFDCLGMDPAEDAVQYVRDSLGLPAVRGFFPETMPRDAAGGFDVITLWYVVEHLAEPRKAFKALVSLLKPGGILAFATPSFSGVTGRFRRRLFLDKSPQDHRILWEPSLMKKIFNLYGMNLERIIVNGHHPERFPLIGKRLGEGSLYRFVKTISVIFCLGDGFEAYGRKRGGL